MIVAYFLSSLTLVGLAYLDHTEIWYPWLIIPHILALLTTEDEFKFISAFFVNLLFIVTCSFFLISQQGLTLISCVVIISNLVMVAAEYRFRVLGTNYRWLMLACTLLILPAGYQSPDNIANAESKHFSMVASGWYKPTSEAQVDIPNVYRHLISKGSLVMQANDPGTINAVVAAQYINHKLIRRGEIFSFNEIVGPRTEKRGFVPSSSYLLTPEGTISVPDIGGGICRTSTLLNDVVEKTKMEILEHHCHSASVRYAAPGEDTAVAWPDLDYKFKNSCFQVIEVLTEYKDDELIIELWGY